GVRCAFPLVPVGGGQGCATGGAGPAIVAGTALARRPRADHWLSITLCLRQADNSITSGGALYVISRIATQIHVAEVHRAGIRSNAQADGLGFRADRAHVANHALLEHEVACGAFNPHADT